MEKFSEESRYIYPLNENSIVLDLGVYEGTFSRLISEKYNCTIYGFEPIKTFFDNSCNNLKSFNKIKLFNFGIGGRTREESISVRNDSVENFSYIGCIKSIRVIIIQAKSLFFSL